jgi:hypothetical protein
MIIVGRNLTKVLHWHDHINGEWTMILNKWPAWHANNELKDEHLLGLEDYVLSRTHILDEQAFGIDYIEDWEKSIQFAWEEKEGVISVGNVRGVTPGGQPVWLGQNEQDRLPPRRMVGTTDHSLQGGVEIAIWIDVNSRGGNSDKLTIDSGFVQPGDFFESGTLGSLFLGHYRLPHPGGDTGLEVIRRPLCRRLCAFGPVSSQGWKSWVADLQRKLEQLLTALSDSTFGGYAAARSELLRLNYEWPVLPIPALARRLRMIAWLLDFEKNHGLAVDLATVIDPLSLEELTGDELPKALAALLPDALPRVESQPKASDLGQSLHCLLELLNRYPVKFHAPIGLLSQWSGELAEAHSGWVLEQNRAAILREIQQPIPERDDWSKAVALITAMNLNSSDLAAVNDCAKHLDKMYRDNAESGPTAGPMAFYWLAKAASLQPTFPNATGTNLRQYFKRLRGGSKSEKSDRLRLYLERVRLPGVANNAVMPYRWWNKRSPRPHPDSSSQLRVVVAGASGSGKSTLIQGLLGSSRRSYTQELPDIGAVEMVGQLANSNASINVRILEIDPSTVDLQSGQFESDRKSVLMEIASTDLLILTIAPSETYERTSTNRLKELAIWMLDKKPSALVALAYTKADEYGAIDIGALRLVNGETQATQVLNMQSVNNPEREFDLFLQNSQEMRSPETTIHGLKVFSQNKRTDRLSETRQHVLKGTKLLWLAIARRRETLLNGYFISAEPCDAYLEPAQRRGIAQLIADFIDYWEGTSL